MSGFTVNLGTNAGASGANVAASLVVVVKATEIRGRYFNFHPNAVIDITVNFVSLSGTTLAQPGPYFFHNRSAGGFDFF